MSARRKAETAKVITIAVRMRASGSGSVISVASTPSSTMGAEPALPAIVMMRRLVALPTRRNPSSTLVMLRSRSRYTPHA